MSVWTCEWVPSCFFSGFRILRLVGPKRCRGETEPRLHTSVGAGAFSPCRLAAAYRQALPCPMIANQGLCETPLGRTQFTRATEGLNPLFRCFLFLIPQPKYPCGRRVNEEPLRHDEHGCALSTASGRSVSSGKDCASRICDWFPLGCSLRQCCLFEGR